MDKALGITTLAIAVNFPFLFLVLTGKTFEHIKVS